MIIWSVMPMSKCLVLFVEGDTEVEFYKHVIANARKLHLSLIHIWKEILSGRDSTVCLNRTSADRVYKKYEKR